MWPANVFSLTPALNTGEAVVLFRSVPQDEVAGRSYALACGTKLPAASPRQGIAGWTNIPALGQTVVHTNPPGTDVSFCRGGVRLVP